MFKYSCQAGRIFIEVLKQLNMPLLFAFIMGVLILCLKLYFPIAGVFQLIVYVIFGVLIFTLLVLKFDKNYVMAILER